VSLIQAVNQRERELSLVEIFTEPFLRRVLV
jgi:hypothetical protein